ncbi:MAG: hypothetical protein J4428_04880 [Candidatus Aenigmarchaeota archaeon]|nr:hypothetical protein [Candidatus Aenigmarchaeota archaeon]
MEIKRQTAIKTRISDIVNSKFIKKEGLEPSYVLTDLGQRISRAKIVGIVTDKFFNDSNSFSSITIDDGTGAVRIKAFQDNIDMLQNLEIGNLLMIIGRVREYAEENYISPEAIKSIANPNYELLHKVEILDNILENRKFLEIVNREKEKISDLNELKNYLNNEFGIGEQIFESILESMNESERMKDNDYKPLLISTLKKMDEGNGVEIIKLLKEVRLPADVFNDILSNLLEEGVFYESMPGVLKLA